MKKTTKLILIWVGVALISVLAFLFLGSGSIFGGDNLVFNVVVNDYTKTTPTYITENFGANPTASEITDITGTSPIPFYIPSGYSLDGVAKFIPVDEAGTKLLDDTVFTEYYTNPASEAYMFSIAVSKSDKFKITQSYSSLNRTLTEDTEKWSHLGGLQVKLFVVKDTSQYFALFIKNDHFWRVDSNNLDQQEFLKVVKNLAMQQ